MRGVTLTMFCDEASSIYRGAPEPTVLYYSMLTMEDVLDLYMPEWP